MVVRDPTGFRLDQCSFKTTVLSSILNIALSNRPYSVAKEHFLSLRASVGRPAEDKRPQGYLPHAAGVEFNGKTPADRLI